MIMLMRETALWREALASTVLGRGQPGVEKTPARASAGAAFSF